MKNKKQTPKWSQFRKPTDKNAFEPPPLIDTGRNPYFGMDFGSSDDLAIITVFDFGDGKIKIIEQMKYDEVDYTFDTIQNSRAYIHKRDLNHAIDFVFDVTDAEVIETTTHKCSKCKINPIYKGFIFCDECLSNLI